MHRATTQRMSKHRRQARRANKLLDRPSEDRQALLAPLLARHVDTTHGHPRGTSPLGLVHMLGNATQGAHVPLRHLPCPWWRR
eukprot:6205564-Pyramimonas_sp.AAC.1